MHVLVDAGLKVNIPQHRAVFFFLFLQLYLKKKVVLSISQLLHLSLKKSKVNSSEASALEMLDPFVLLLLECFDSMHVKV